LLELAREAGIGMTSLPPDKGRPQEKKSSARSPVFEGEEKRQG